MIQRLGNEPVTIDMTVLKQNSVKETYPLHTHTFYEYFLVNKGRALHIVNDTAQIVERGSLVLIRPDDRHYYNYYQSQDFEFYNVGVSKEQFDKVNMFYDGALKIINDNPLPGHIMLDETLTRQLEEHIIELKNQTPSIQRDQLFLMLLSMVVYYMMNIKQDQNPPSVPAWLVSVLNEFDKPENFIKGLPRLLELCNYSQEHINRVFKRYINTTPTRYINEKRLTYANKLLEETLLTVLEVCERSGFHSTSHFYTQYKKFYGYPPQSTRNTKE